MAAPGETDWAERERALVGLVEDILREARKAGATAAEASLAEEEGLINLIVEILMYTL